MGKPDAILHGTSGHQVVEEQQHDRPKRRHQDGPDVEVRRSCPAEDANDEAPTDAPAIPKRTVTMKPPGSDPDMTRLASNPAISPTTIHEMSPTFLPPSFTESFRFDG